MIYGSVENFSGQVGVVMPGNGPCYRCLYPAPPPPGLSPSCAEIGVLGIVPGLVGSCQAAEALKIVLGLGTPLVGRLLRIDVLTSGFRVYETARDPNCAACGERPQAETIAQPSLRIIDAASLRAKLSTAHPLFLIDVRNADEFSTGSIAGARLIPLPILSQVLPELDLTQEIVVYCKSGNRSALAAKLLQDHGFTNVHHLAGGIVQFNLSGQAA